MLPYFTAAYGNAASSDHSMGIEARQAVDQARQRVAELVGASPEDVIFTSGSTEANNLVLSTRLPLLTSAIEHPSILDVVRNARIGLRNQVVRVNAEGYAEPDELSMHIGKEKEPCLVSIMLVNNEIGTHNDVKLLADTAHSKGALFHTDATQALAFEDVDMRADMIDGLSVSAHKLYGPKGVGALICRPKLRRHLSPTLYGGGHERGLRSGTLNVPGIVGFGEAARLAIRDRSVRRRLIVALREAFIKHLLSSFAGASTVNGAATSETHICSIRLHGVNNRALLNQTSKLLCYSLGSACATMKSEPSHVLLALGQCKREANETIRISFGVGLDVQSVSSAGTAIGEAATRLLKMVA